MALLDLMHRHGSNRGFSVVAVTVDHGLRPEAAEEIAHVAAFCQSRDIGHHVLHWTWDHVGNCKPKPASAVWLDRRLGEGDGVDLIALGHTKDDQAETFLMRLARQAGVEGLSEMKVALCVTALIGVGRCWGHTL